MALQHHSGTPKEKRSNIETRKGKVVIEEWAIQNREFEREKSVEIVKDLLWTPAVLVF